MGHEEQAVEQPTAPNISAAQGSDASGGGVGGSLLRVPLAEQIKEVEAELAIRAEVYPRLTAKLPKRAAEFERRGARLRAVLATLQWLARNETRIKALPK